MPFSDSLFLGLIHNGAILIAVTIIYDYFWKRDPDLKSLKNQLFVGLLIGSAAFIIMRTTWVLEEGTGGPRAQCQQSHTRASARV